MHYKNELKKAISSNDIARQRVILSIIKVLVPNMMFKRK